jgi:hypothetical protein
MSDVPYSAYFICEDHIIVSKVSETKCKMVSEVAIIFNKSTYLKNKILSRTYEDMK